MRNLFHMQLHELQGVSLEMGHLVAEAIETAATALMRGDKELARRVVAADDAIDGLQIEIQMRALQLMALQQPMARDLRTLGTVIKLATDLERMADHATDIANITVRLQGEPLPERFAGIGLMASKAREMTQHALWAYEHEDEAAARKMIETDHEIDHIYRRLFDDLMAYMQEDPARVPLAVRLLHVAMYLERIGDHATNLGEWTIYMLTGELKELNV